MEGTGISTGFIPFDLTARACKCNFPAASMSPFRLVPCLPVPAYNLIWLTDIFKPKDAATEARQAAPQSDTSRCFTSILFFIQIIYQSTNRINEKETSAEVSLMIHLRAESASF